MIKLIALGNRLRGDDAIGPYVLDRMQQTHSSMPFQFIEAGADAFTLLEHLSGPQPIILIDCADMKCAPGTVRRLRIDQNFKTEQDMISLHGFSFAEILNLARSIGPVAPTTIIGIQPQSLQMGSELSPEVKAAVPKIIQMITEEAQEYAEKNLNY